MRNPPNAGKFRATVSRLKLALHINLPSPFPGYCRQQRFTRTLSSVTSHSTSTPPPTQLGQDKHALSQTASPALSNYYGRRLQDVLWLAEAYRELQSVIFERVVTRLKAPQEAECLPLKTQVLEAKKVSSELKSRLLGDLRRTDIWAAEQAAVLKEAKLTEEMYCDMRNLRKLRNKMVHPPVNDLRDIYVAFKEFKKTHPTNHRASPKAAKK